MRPAGGGAILNISSAARLTLANSTVTGNTTQCRICGGTVVSARTGTTLVIAGSTISGNSTTANTSTGGVFAYQGGAVTLTDTISAGNTVSGTGGSPDLYSTTANTPFNGTNNLIGVGDGSTNFTGLTNGTNGNQTGTAGAPLNPLLDPLASNGGTVQTFALLPGSPAIDTRACPTPTPPARRKPSPPTRAVSPARKARPATRGRTKCRCQPALYGHARGGRRE